MTRFFELIKWHSFQTFLKLKSFLVSILLAFIYFIGFGLTRFLLIFYQRDLLKRFVSKKSEESYWVDAKGYTKDKEKLLRQL